MARGYWLYFQIGRGGWFAETADGSLPDLVIGKDRPDAKELFLDVEGWLRTKPLLEQKPIIIE